MIFVKCCTLGTRGKTQIVQKNVAHWGQCCTLGCCTLGATGVYHIVFIAEVDLSPILLFDIKLEDGCSPSNKTDQLISFRQTFNFKRPKVSLIIFGHF